MGPSVMRHSNIDPNTQLSLASLGDGYSFTYEGEFEGTFLTKP